MDSDADTADAKTVDAMSRRLTESEEVEDNDGADMLLVVEGRLDISMQWYAVRTARDRKFVCWRQADVVILPRFNTL